MKTLDSFKLEKQQMNKIAGGNTIICKVKYPDGSWNYKVVNTTRSVEETEGELNSQSMGAYAVSC